jgi:hypothetical protein
LKLPLVSEHCDGIKQADADNKTVTAAWACYPEEAKQEFEVDLIVPSQT